MRLYICVIVCLLLADGAFCRRRGRRRKTSRLADVAQTQVSKGRPVPQVPSQSQVPATAEDSDCAVEYDSVPEDHIKPLLLRQDKAGLVYPDEEGGRRLLRVTSSSSVTAVCPGTGNRLSVNGRQTATIKCVQGTLYYGRRRTSWPALRCSKKPTPTLQERGRCGTGGTAFTVSWEVSRGVSVPQVTLCFDKERETTLYSYHLVEGRNIDSKTIEPSRPSFKKAGMFSTDVVSAYRIAEEKKLLKSLTGNPFSLTGRGQHYLAKGHLTPDSDFVLEAEQDATYYYANAVPQWQAINNGNWKSLEYSIRDLAMKHGTILQVWTGTHGTLALPTPRSYPVEVFLGLREARASVPVPAYMWKVVYELYSNEALALVMVNSVSQGGTDGGRDLFSPPCSDLCSSVAWVDWDVNDVTKGRTYCCRLSDLRSTFDNLPDLGRVGTLRN